MVNWTRNIFVKYKELIFYGIFGLGATGINILSFCLLRQAVGADLFVSNVLAWIFAFVFAFVTNKLWVFQSKNWKSQTAFREMKNFFIARRVTLALDTFCMWLMIEIMDINDLISKIMVNIIVIAVNYAASKYWIFSNKTMGSNHNGKSL